MRGSTTDPRDANLPPFRPYAIITAPADASWYTERPEWARVEPVTTWHGIYVWDREDQNAHEEGEFETRAEALAWAIQRTKYVRLVGNGGVSTLQPDGAWTEPARAQQG